MDGIVLEHLLKGTFALFGKTLNYHWNVTGPNFSEIHLLLDKHYAMLLEGADTIAEYMRSLKMIVAPQILSESESIFLTNPHQSALEMVSDLSLDHEYLIVYIKEQAVNVTDISLSDLLVERCREHEKMAWMLRSYEALS